jgi:hypothetical protein
VGVAKKNMGVYSVYQQQWVFKWFLTSKHGTKQKQHGGVQKKGLARHEKGTRLQQEWV